MHCSVCGSREFRAVLPSGESPDRVRVELSQSEEPTFRSYLVSVDGTGLQRGRTSPEFDGFPMFNPDRRTLVFASNRNARGPGETNIFIADWLQ